MSPARVVALMEGVGPAVTEAGAKALLRITIEEGRRDEVVAAGTLPLLVRALTDHAHHARFCEMASTALFSIAFNSDARKQAVVAAGALPLLARALTNHSNHAEVYLHVSGAQHNVAIGSASRKAVWRRRGRRLPSRPHGTTTQATLGETPTARSQHSATMTTARRCEAATAATTARQVVWLTEYARRRGGRGGANDTKWVGGDYESSFLCITSCMFW